MARRVNSESDARLARLEAEVDACKEREIELRAFHAGLHQWKNDFAIPQANRIETMLLGISHRLERAEAHIGRFSGVVVGTSPDESGGLRAFVTGLEKKLDKHIQENTDQSKEFTRQLTEMNGRFDKYAKWVGIGGTVIIGLMTPEKIGYIVKMIAGGAK